jgi:hypothetical protein
MTKLEMMIANLKGEAARTCAVIGALRDDHARQHREAQAEWERWNRLCGRCEQLLAELTDLRQALGVPLGGVLNRDDDDLHDPRERTHDPDSPGDDLPPGPDPDPAHLGGL